MKPTNQTSRHYDEHGVIINSTNPKEVGMTRFQINNLSQQSTSTREEMLLPMGFTLQENGRIETPFERQNNLLKKQKPKQINDDSDMLLPLGVELEE